MTENDTRDPSESPAGFEGVPEPIVDLCRACVQYVHRATGIEPDFQPETLSLVDHYAAEARAALEVRPETLPLVAQAVGAYFGEVLRRSTNGFWRIPSPNFHDWQVCGSVAFLAVNPIGVGYDAVVGGEDHEGPRSQIRVAPEDRVGVEMRLADLPAVPEDQYFTLCTRLEVLEIAMDAVRAQQIARGYDEITFDPEDYEAELRPLGLH